MSACLPLLDTLIGSVVPVCLSRTTMRSVAFVSRASGSGAPATNAMSRSFSLLVAPAGCSGVARPGG